MNNKRLLIFAAKLNISMNRKIKGLLAVFAACAIFFSSCTTSKEVQYIQDYPAGTVESATPNKGLVIEPNDLLNIVITTKDPELGTQFNLQPGTVSAAFENTSMSSSMQNSKVTKGYRVDTEGNIVFPLLGTIHVAGLTRAECENLIKSRIQKEGLLKDFTVLVDFVNARISIIGDVKAPGNYQFPDDKYTILQALADAGDLLITAKRVVTVVREKGGQRKVYEVDLKSRDLFNSPVYYLQQNDVIYVVPNEKKMAEADSNASQWRQISTWMGLASFVASMVTIIIAIAK